MFCLGHSYSIRPALIAMCSLTYLQQHPRRVQIRDRAGRRSFVIANVKTIETAVDILSEIVALPTS